MDHHCPGGGLTFWRLTGDGIEIRLRVTPGASRDEVVGVVAGADDDLRLSVRVRAVPEKGRANKAVERLIAEILDVSRGCVSVAAGATGRAKTVRLEADPVQVKRSVAVLEALGASASPEAARRLRT